MLLLTSVIVHFLKGLEDMSQNFQIENPYKRPWCMCENDFDYYVTSVIDTIVSVRSGFITEERIAAYDFNLYFHRYKND